MSEYQKGESATDEQKDVYNSENWNEHSFSLSSNRLLITKNFIKFYI